MTDFPTDLDSLSNPTGTDYQNSPAHATQHINANDAIEALEAKVGKDSSAVTTSHDYKLSSVTSTAKTVATTGTQTVAGVKTFSSAPVFSAGVQIADDQDIAFASGAKIERVAGNLVLTPETSKLVKIAVLQQAHITDAYNNNSVILTGWGYVAGTDGQVYTVAETITFGITFAAAPIVLINFIGQSGTTYGSGTSIVGHALNARMETNNPTTTSVQFSGYSEVGVNTAAATNYLYTWIAIGVPA